MAIEGKDLHYTRVGRAGGAPVLVLHGITESRRYFDRSLSPLGARFELWIPDLPGFGLSPKPPVRYSMEFFLRVVESFLDHHGLGERPIRIVAHSLGALIALEYAAAHPDHVRRMVLLNLPRHASRE